jgi:hypothetical protein
MLKEFEFFIKENLSRVIVMAEEKKQQGAIVVGNTEQLLNYLKQHTRPDDDLSCWISGAWLDECVRRSVRLLLTQDTLLDNLPQRNVSAVVVDLTTCVAFLERLTEMSIEERRSILEMSLYDVAKDPRLTILPKSST